MHLRPFPKGVRVTFYLQDDQSTIGVPCYLLPYILEMYNKSALFSIFPNASKVSDCDVHL